MLLMRNFVGSMALGSMMACGPTGGDDDGDDDGGGDATTGPGDSTSTPSVSDTSADDGDSTGSSGRPTTTGSSSCPPLVELVCEDVENAKVLPENVIDCSNLTLDDTDAELWAAAQQCVLDNVAIGGAFKFVFEQQGIDSQVSSGYGGIIGFTYQMVTYFRDEGGFNPGSITTRTDCGNIEPLANCMPGVGEPCLLCAFVDDSTLTLCEDQG
jgi:hypothetical protein